jgi:hypothetical protein
MRKQQKERARAEHTKKIAISQRGLDECAVAVLHSGCLLMIFQVPQRGEKEAMP